MVSEHLWVVLMLYRGIDQTRKILDYQPSLYELCHFHPRPSEKATVHPDKATMTFRGWIGFQKWARTAHPQGRDELLEDTKLLLEHPELLKSMESYQLFWIVLFAPHAHVYSFAGHGREQPWHPTCQRSQKYWKEMFLALELTASWA